MGMVGLLPANHGQRLRMPQCGYKYAALLAADVVDGTGSMNAPRVQVTGFGVLLGYAAVPAVIIGRLNAVAQ